MACVVAPEGEAVDGERVGQQVEVLSLVADRVGSAEPEGVVEGPVDGLGVPSPRVLAEGQIAAPGGQGFR